MDQPRAQVSSDHVSTLVGEFIHIVSDLPHVRQVLLEATDVGPTVWTVIDAEPFKQDERDLVYDAELRVIERRPNLDVDFRLINVAEYGDEAEEGLLPTRARTLWRRDPE